MPKIPGVPHLRAVRALEKEGFKIIREGKHIVMSDGVRFVTVPPRGLVQLIFSPPVAAGGVLLLLWLHPAATGRLKILCVRRQRDSRRKHKR